MDTIPTQKIPISKIIIDEKVLPREKINEEHVDNLVKALKEGAELPLPDVFFDGKRYLVGDGRHRYEAFIRAGRKTIEAKIHQGDTREAFIYSCGVNAKHGLPLSNADKRKVVDRLLRDSEWCKWTDVRIAELCKVSSAFVGIRRKKLTLKGLMSPSERVDSKGRNLNVAKIGKGKSLEQELGEIHMVKVPLPIPNPPKQSSTPDASEKKTNPFAKPRSKPKRGKPKTWKVSKAENSETRKQIAEAIARLHKLDEMLESNKTWTKDKAKKLKTANEEIQLRCLSIGRFAQSLISKFD